MPERGSGVHVRSIVQSELRTNDAGQGVWDVHECIPNAFGNESIKAAKSFPAYTFRRFIVLCGNAFRVYDEINSLEAECSDGSSSEQEQAPTARVKILSGCSSGRDALRPHVAVPRCPSDLPEMSIEVLGDWREASRRARQAQTTNFQPPARCGGASGGLVAVTI